MATHDATWMNDWTVGMRLWTERCGRAILGPGRLELLEWIDRCHSISEAARQLHMSYRRAWLLVESINKAAGEALVETKTGGSHGGGAVLTAHGRVAVSAFRDLQGRLRQRAAALLPRVLPGAARDVVHVAAAVSLEEVLGQLAADFALSQPAYQARIVYGASDELAEHILGGAAVNLFVSADPGQVERLRTAGLVEGACKRLTQNTLAVIAIADWPHALRSAADLAGPQVTSIALADPSSPLGRYTRRYLEKHRVHERIRDRQVVVDNARAVIAALRAGLAPVGLIYGSDVIHAAGCRLLFRIRHEPPAIEYQAALVAGTGSADCAQAFLSFLLSSKATDRFRQCGFLAVK
jgi:molybdenum ABC transporter molybdate-binding protein